MNIIDTAQTLIKFRTETGNIDEIRKCMSYMKGLSGLTSARIDIFQKAHLAPVFFARNTNSLDFDVLILGHIDVVPATDDMFVPEIKNGKLFGRGALDMKSFAFDYNHRHNKTNQNKTLQVLCDDNVVHPQSYMAK